MADVTIKIDVDAKTAGIERVRAQLASLSAQARQAGSRFADLLDRSDALRRGFSQLDDALADSEDGLERVDKKSKKTSKGIKSLLKIITSFSKLLMKAFVINLAAAGATLVAVNLAFKAGAVLAKGYKAAMSGLFQAITGGGATAIAVLSTFLAGQKQFLAAQQASRYGGGFKGLTQASSAMRSLTGNTNLAVLGTEALQGAFAALSQHTRMSGQLSQALTAMGDFAAASSDPKKSFAAAGAFLGQLQKKGRLTSDIIASAKEIGPEFEKAVKEAQKKGITSSSAFLSALVGGDLSKEVAGQLELVNSTLFGTAKRYFGVIKNMFTDFGQPLLRPATEALQRIAQIFQRTFMSISGDVRAFADGTLFDTVVSAIDRFGHWTTKLFDEYLPATVGFFDRIKAVFEPIVGWFSRFKETIRPLVEGGQVLIDTFKPLLKGMFQSFGQGLFYLNDQIMENKDAFLEFGQSLLRLFNEIASIFGDVKEIFIDFLPTISRLIDLFTTLIDLIADVFAPILRNIATFTNYMTGLPGILGEIATALTAVGLAMLFVAKSAIGAALAGKTGMMGTLGKGILKGGAKAVGKLGGAGMARVGSVAAAGYGAYKAWNSESAVGGALWGAGAGAALGANFGPYGALAGLAIGALVGGIRGKLNEGKKRMEEVRKAAAEYAAALTDTAKKGLAEGNVGVARRSVSAIEDRARRISDIVNQYGLSGGGTDTIAKTAELLRQGIITKEEFDKLSKAPITYANALKEQAATMREDLNPLIEKFNDNTAMLSKITGKSQAEIERLADALNLDLSKSLTNVGEIVSQLTGMVVYGTESEMRAAFKDAFSKSLIDAFQTPGELRQAGEAVTEAERALRDVVASGGTPDAKMIEDYLMTAAQYDLAQGRTPAETIRRMTGLLTKESALFGASGMFSGMGDTLIPLFSSTMGPVLQSMLNSPEFLSSALTASSAFAETGINISAPDLMSALNTGVAGAKGPEAKGLYIANFMEAMQAVISGTATPQMLSILGATQPSLYPGGGGSHGSARGLGTGNDLNAMNANTIQTWLKSMGLDVAVEGISTSMSTTAGFFTTFNTTIETAIRTLQAANENNWWLQPTTTTDPPDTTSSRLAATLGKHMNYNSMLPGKRTITSSYRTNNLGSLNSDHLTGNAYDLVGQNLVSYAQLVRDSGGFAEFHGGTSNRHLHVVPGAGPSGDTMAPVGSLAPTVAASGNSTNNSYQIVINPTQNATAQEIANAVMEKIYREQRSARERS